MSESTPMFELVNETWLMDQRSLGAMLAQFREGRNMPEQAAGTADGSGRYGVRVEGETAYIQIAGPLLQTVPKWLAMWRRIFGDVVTGYDEIIEDVSAAVADEDVKRIVLEVDSPGGSAFGVTEAAAAIAAANGAKPVTAMIGGYGTSAAYLLASQAGKVIAEPNAVVGSIGTIIVLVDSSKAFEDAGFRVIPVVSGPHKATGRPGVEITPEQLEPMQAVIDGITTNFIQAVAAGRGMAVAEVRKLADGRMWVAADAKKAGLIDGVGLTETALAEGRPAGDMKQESDTMGNETKEAPAADQLDAAKKAGQAAGAKAMQEQFAALTAAFPDDPMFAAAQFALGHDVPQAKADFSEVLAKRNAELTTKVGELEEAATKAAETKPKTPKTPANTGTVPVGNEGEAGSETSGGFLEQAKALAKEESIPVSQAQSRIAKEQPEVYESYRAGLKPLKATG